MREHPAEGAETTAPALPSPKERRRLREAKSLSEEQVAEAVGVTKATVKSWEAGRTSPRGRKREAYAKLLAPYEAEISAMKTKEAKEAKEAEELETHEGGALSASAPPAPPSPSRHRTPPVPQPPPPAHEPDLTPEEAFDALYARTAPALVRQACLLTGRRGLALESVEHAFHLAWERWPEVAVDRDPAGWVRAAAYEYALSPWHRLRRSHRRPDPDPVPDPALPALLSTAPDPCRLTLRKALLELPPVYRRTLLLYDGLGLDLPETAAETEASTPAAANRVLHARAVVADRLPELADPQALHEQLGGLVHAVSTPKVPTARAVRIAGERRTQLRTRAVFGLTALILAAAAFTAATSEGHYEPPQAPGEAVGGVPPRGGPQSYTKAEVNLRNMLHSHPHAGPQRLIPRVG
ncbi:sigma factor-like helix-turn-helix DNA-binding protein [Streptomyces sp. NPDC054841]